MGFFDDILSGLGLIKSDQQQEQERLASRVGNSQADRIDQGTELRRRAEAVLGDLAGGGPPPVWHLGTRPGEGSDIDEFMGQLGHNAEFNKLLELIGVGEGSVATANSALGTATGMEANRQKQLQDLASALLFGFGGGGGAGV